MKCPYCGSSHIFISKSYFRHWVSTGGICHTKNNSLCMSCTKEFKYDSSESNGFKPYKIPK